METLLIFRPKWMYVMGMVLLLSLLGGCQESEVPDKVRTLDDAYAVIVGEWEWTKSVLMERIGTTVQSPESEGLARRYIFKSDRTMQFIENDIVMRDSEYRIETHESTFLLRLMDTGGSAGISFNVDTLVLTNPALGHAHYYIRK
jgi:hypothetical protein